MMMQDVRAPAIERAGIWPFVGAWLLACTIMLAVSWRGIVSLEFPDPDDALRLQQVRDWMAGQSWFDVTQYRLNPPDGAPMHWSRLVDVPIAAVILVLRPLFGAAGAELGALIAVPLLTLAAVMALVAKLAGRLLDREHALLATLLVPVSVAAMAQLRPLRIDHHGWQIALALAAVLAAMDGRRIRSGMVAGGIAALWLHISLEGLPLTAALAALFGLRWLIDPGERDRLLAFMSALAGASLFFFLLTRAPAVWAVTHCDSISAAHLAVFAAGALGVWAIRVTGLRSLPARFGACIALGGIALAVMLAAAPQCASGPFEALDPLVRRFWYDNVLEGQPIWRQSPSIAAVVIAFPLIGLWGTWRALDNSSGSRRGEWTVLLFMLLAAVIASIFVQRTGAVANMLALPGGVYLFNKALARARTIRTVAVRLGATLGAMLLVTPAYAVSALDSAASNLGNEQKGTLVRDCVTQEAIGRLAALPVGTIAAPLDITPSIIVYTRHRAIASGHHRNSAAMAEVIRMFTARPGEARAMMARRNVAYVAVCPDLIEPGLYEEEGPDGLWSELKRGHTPAWLEPVRFAEPSPLKVWRVKG